MMCRDIPIGAYHYNLAKNIVLQKIDNKNIKIILPFNTGFKIDQIYPYNVILEEREVITLEKLNELKSYAL